MCTRVSCHALSSGRNMTHHQYVTQQLANNPRWPCDIDHGLTTDTTFRNDFCRLAGQQQIRIANERWHTRAMRDLPAVQWTATAAAPCLDDANSVCFTRTIRWIPPSIQWLVRHGRPPCTMHHYHRYAGRPCGDRAWLATRVCGNLDAV